MKNFKRSPAKPGIRPLIAFLTSEQSPIARKAIYDVITALRGPDDAERNEDIARLKAATMLLRSYVGIERSMGYSGWTLQAWNRVRMIPNEKEIEREISQFNPIYHKYRRAGSYEEFLKFLKVMLHEIQFMASHVESHLTCAIEAIGVSELYNFAEAFGAEHGYLDKTQ